MGLESLGADGCCHSPKNRGHPQRRDQKAKIFVTLERNMRFHLIPLARPGNRGSPGMMGPADSKPIMLWLHRAALLVRRKLEEGSASGWTLALSADSIPAT
jgi:hypothetical protein